MALLPKVKLKAVVSFPATVLDGAGIDVVKANGNFTLNLAYDDFAPPATGLTDPANQNVLVWNSLTNSYVLVPSSALSGVPATAVPLIESGAGAVGTSVKYAREDHVHPALGGGGGATVLLSDTPPAGAADNSLWVESDTGILYLRWNDGNSTQWVAISGGYVIDAVRYGAAQTLTSGQQTQARTNINAAGAYGTQTFTNPGNFTTPADSSTSTVFRYRLVGAGGGGGGCSSTGAAGGGGSGAYAEGTFTGVAPSTAISITIGTSGTGGTAGNTGGTGGNSSIGSPVNITAGGGAGGVGIATANNSLPGAGGTITGTPNIVALTGHRGVPGYTPLLGGYGGNTPLGFGGEPGLQNVANGGSPGTGFGSGGGGASGAAAGGGNGTQGIAIIEWVL